MNRFRCKRFRLFREMLGVTDSTPILDVGGLPDHWLEYDFSGPVTCVNLSMSYPEGTYRKPNIRYVRHDACCLPFADGSIEVAFSNSLLEHVGLDRQPLVAREIRRVAKKYWVQVPCRNFFFEPHYRALFFWQLPRAARRCVARFWTPLVMERNYYLPEVDTMHLLDEKAMRKLFPDANILRETICGFTKSLIAWKTSTP